MGPFAYNYKVTGTIIHIDQLKYNCDTTPKRDTSLMEEYMMQGTELKTQDIDTQ